MELDLNYSSISSRSGREGIIDPAGEPTNQSRRWIERNKHSRVVVSSNGNTTTGGRTFTRNHNGCRRWRRTAHVSGRARRRRRTTAEADDARGQRTANTRTERLVERSPKNVRPGTTDMRTGPQELRRQRRQQPPTRLVA